MPETKGITIEFYGKSIDLQNNIKDINKGLSATKAELNDVRKQLKLDPHNVELVAKQLKILRQEQTLAAEKAEYFRKELSKMGADDIGSDKWVRYTKEVNKAETSVQAIQRQIDEIDKQSLDTIQNEAKQTGEAFQEASTKVVTMGDLIKANVISQAIISGIKTIANELKSAATELNQWANDFRETQVYEKQFESNIRNTADATDEEIASLKKLAKQKERQGVISSKAITSAYQELATYVESADAIEGLTDALTDMAAQQYGVDATDESVRNLATTLGKALANGDYSGLTRLGYGFDEAQKKIMQYGTEAQRVAVLNDVISASIGGMNEALAQTDAGQLFAVKTYFDDVKQSVGELVSELQIGFVQEVMPALQPLIDDILSYIIDNKDSIIGTAKSVAEWLTSEDMKNFYKDIGQLVLDFGDILLTIGKIGDDIGLWEGIFNAVKGIVEGIKELFDSIANDVAKIKSGGLGSWLMGNYNSYSWDSGGFGSGGFSSGGMMSNITLNNTFTVNNGSVTESQLRSWANIITDQVNENLGRMV